MTVQANEVLETASAWLEEGASRVAIATVVGTWGSSPRPVGSQLAVDESGRFVGSVSGGCVEGAVIGEAMKAMEDGAPRLVEFSVSDADAREAGLTCGGTVRIFIESIQ
jgi:xanthine/CO dehydrogenase XdhC/CoxF family maturation factor